MLTNKFNQFLSLFHHKYNTMISKKEQKEAILAIRVSEALADKAKELVKLERVRTGYKVSRTDILRRAVAVGLAHLEKEFRSED